MTRNDNRGIYKLSRAVNEGNAERAIEVLRSGGGSPDSQISWRPSPEAAHLKEALRPHVLNNYTAYLKYEYPSGNIVGFVQPRCHPGLLHPTQGGSRFIVHRPPG